MSTLSSIRSFLFLMILLVSLVALSGCMTMTHHGQGPIAQTEPSAVLHDGHETATVQPVQAETSKPDQQRQHESKGIMPLMHGSGGWHWAGMGMMMAVMLLIIL